MQIHKRYERDGVYTTIEMLRRDTFSEWSWDKEFMRKTMRHVFKKDDQILELGSHTGELSMWLNQTGW
jgi:hypothetical protein